MSLITQDIMNQKKESQISGDNQGVIIETHEDGSECRKCKNCACLNNASNPSLKSEKISKPMTDSIIVELNILP